MEWLFREIGADEVETELTQRDQFNNDEVDLSEALVRETIQNSLDASLPDGPVHVRFSFIDQSMGLDPVKFKVLFDGLVPHLNEVGLLQNGFDWDKPSVLLIEDFGTSGLTGSFHEKDEGNFSDFWRRHGRSHKQGGRGGRWGLGKLVYSSSSRLRTFFGLTIRIDDRLELLMGQSVLKTHKLNQTEYAPHGFYAEKVGSGFQLPTQDSEIISGLKQIIGSDRRNHSGLSILVVFPNEELRPESLMEVAIRNYFFPVLTKKLTLEINGERLDHGSIRNLNKKYGASTDPDIEKLFNFIESCHKFDKKDFVAAKPDWRNDGKVLEDDFNPEDVERLRQKFTKQGLVAVRFPVGIALKDGQKQDSYFDAFLKAEDGISAGKDLYVRGGITVPSEKKFGDRRSFGVLIAEDAPISGFLGDAENAAHTRWNSRAEKLNKYKNAAATLKVVRNSLVQLYDIFAQSADSVDEDALTDYFSITAPLENKEKSGKPKTPPNPFPDIPPPKPKPFRISAIQSGFSVSPADPIPPEELPRRVNLQVAYDLLRGNPFKKYSSIDFELGDEPIQVEATGISILGVSENTLSFEILEPAFHLKVDGFDPKRYTLVKASDGGQP